MDINRVATEIGWNEKAIRWFIKMTKVAREEILLLLQKCVVYDIINLPKIQNLTERYHDRNSKTHSASVYSK